MQNDLQVKYSIGVGNGFDGLVLALKALGVGRGDRVAVPCHTFIATWNAISSVGAIPVGIDVNSLLADFNDFMTNQLPTLESTVSSLNTTVTDVVLPAISSLETSVASIGSQTTTNTGDITGLTEIGRAHV